MRAFGMIGAVLALSCGTPPDPVTVAPSSIRETQTDAATDAATDAMVDAGPASRVPRLTCPDQGGCLQRARSAKTSIEALAYFEAACRLGNVIGCFDATERADEDERALLANEVCEKGSLEACQAIAREAGDSPVGRRAFGKACERAANEAEATFMLSSACEKAISAYVHHDEHQAAFDLATLACPAKSLAACAWLGAFYDTGRIVTADPKRAQQLYLQACPTKNCNSPDIRRAVKEGSDIGLPVEGATLTMDRVSAGPFMLIHTTCRTSGQIAESAFVAPFAARQKALDACAAKGGGAFVRARFTSTSGAISKVDVRGNPTNVEACVAKVLEPIRVPLDGTCRIEFGIGVLSGGILH